MRVDFPAPFSPNRARTSFSLTDSVTLSLATTPGNVLVIPSISIAYLSTPFPHSYEKGAAQKKILRTAPIVSQVELVIHSTKSSRSNSSGHGILVGSNNLNLSTDDVSLQALDLLYNGS